MLGHHPSTPTAVAAEQGADRSASPDVRNPLLKLPAAAAFDALPDADRHALRALLDDLRRDARAVSDALYRRNRVRVAAYWKACSVYAGHTARLVHPRSGPKLVCSATPAPAGGLGRHPLLTRAGAQALRDLSPSARGAMRALLRDLRIDAAANAKKCWEKHKSPMSAYWGDVATYAGISARFLRDPVLAGAALSELRVAA